MDGITLTKELRKEIWAQLRTCTFDKTPMVYEMIQTPSGYQKIEQMIINMVIDDGITPSAAIPQIEMIYE